MAGAEENNIAAVLPCGISEGGNDNGISLSRGESESMGKAVTGNEVARVKFATLAGGMRNRDHQKKSARRASNLEKAHAGGASRRHR